MSLFGPVKSLNFYSGTIAVAAGFSGDKDVTITSVEPTKAFAQPALTVPITSMVAGFLGYGAGVGTGVSQLSWDHVEIPTATAFRFKSVFNSSGVPDTIRYAFWVVEYF